MHCRETCTKIKKTAIMSSSSKNWRILKKIYRNSDFLIQ